MKLPSKIARIALALLSLQGLLLLHVYSVARAEGSAWPDQWVADSAFYNVWARADQPVAAGRVARSWMWGPVPFAVANETYAESPTSRRLVEYLDKARMEVNDPAADRATSWFVTSGLLVNEMVTGQVQTGNNRLDPRPPADVPVAGDTTSPNAPTYATFSRYTGPTPKSLGALVKQRIARDGTLSVLSGQGAPSDPRLFGLTSYDDVSKHNIPGVFVDWMGQSGTVLEGGRLTQGRLLDPLYVLGHPITEAYWADVLVNGAPTSILVQLFERRALTYNPNNAPQWRVEMANVGRAYYDWRYKGSPVEPAIAVSVGNDSLLVRGWNWPPGNPAHVEVDLAGGLAPLAGPQDATPDPSGRFSLALPLNAQLQGALQSGANLQVKANGPQFTAALPLASKSKTGNVTLEGTISQAPDGQATPQTLQMRTRDGSEWTLDVGANSKLNYSEGSVAPVQAVRPGASVSVNGIASGGRVAVAEMNILSLSRTGAHFGYAWQPDGKSLRISGTGWPAERTISFTLTRPNIGEPPPLTTARADSRGNLSALVKLPNGAPTEGQWLFATASDKGALLAQVALPLATDTRSPQLIAQSAAGEQLAGVGSYCWTTTNQRTCVDAIGAPLPGAGLQAQAGETLLLRSQYGPDPNAGLTPDTFSAHLYPYPDSQITPDGPLYFAPTSQPVYSTGSIPGRPFSVALPTTLSKGRYILLVDVKWPDAPVGSGSATYGFTLSVVGSP